jgi:hypothetical protein
MRLGDKFVETFVGLYTLRAVWRHGHHLEAAAIFVAAGLLNLLSYWMERGDVQRIELMRKKFESRVVTPGAIRKIGSRP